MEHIKKTPIYEMVAEEIKKYIQEQQLKDGDKMPSIEALTNRLGVSRSSLRESLRYLEAMDLIQVINGKGIFVRNADSYRIEARIKIENEKNMLLYISEVRRALEGKAVELATERATADHIKRMHMHLERYGELKKRNEDKSQADLAFHQTIYEAANNPVLEGVIESIWETFKKFWMKPFGIEEIFDDTYPLHYSLLEAIKSKDKQQAMIEFNKLMDAVEDTIRQIDL